LANAIRIHLILPGFGLCNQQQRTKAQRHRNAQGWSKKAGVPRVVSTDALMIGRCFLDPPWMGSVISASSGGEQSRRLDLFRKPRRITITVSQRTAELLVERSLREGRSLSNLAAVLLERAIKAEQANPPALDWQPRRLLSHSQDEVHG